MTDAGEAANARLYLDAAQAQLGERVTNLNRRQSDLEQEVRVGFRQIETSFATFTNETRTSIAAISQSLGERNKPQWQAIGVALTFAVIVGGMAYWPIREATSDLKASVAAITEKMVTRDELDYRARRGEEDRKSTNETIAFLRDQQVPRKEYDERWRGADQRFSDVQRQIDSISTAFGGSYSLRDALLDMKDKIERLEREQKPSS